GANTVNGPGLFNVSTRPAAFTAATSVVWSFDFTALSTMSLDGYIGAPPTITVFSFILPPPIILSCASTGAISAVVRVSAPKAAASKAMRFDMEISQGVCSAGEGRRADGRSRVLLPGRLRGRWPELREVAAAVSRKNS